MCQEGHFVIENISFYDDTKLGTELTAEADWKRRGLYLGPQVTNPNLFVDSRHMPSCNAKSDISLYPPCIVWDSGCCRARWIWEIPPGKRHQHFRSFIHSRVCRAQRATGAFLSSCLLIGLLTHSLTVLCRSMWSGWVKSRTSSTSRACSLSLKMQYGVRGPTV